MPSDASSVLSRPPCGTRRERSLVKLRSLQHVSSPYPEGAHDSVRRFYGEVLGLHEQPTPSTLAGMSLLWFSAGEGLELHFFPGPPEVESRRHFCFDIGDLEETRRRLADFALSAALALASGVALFLLGQVVVIPDFTVVTTNFSFLLAYRAFRPKPPAGTLNQPV